MIKLVSLTVLAISFPLFAKSGSRPSIPAPEIDPALIQDGKTVREFFENRAKDAACQSDLTKAKADYRQKLKEVEDLKATRVLTTDGKEDATLKSINDKIDAMNAPLIALRDKMLVLIDKCGECATHEVESRDVDAGAGKTENWYISDGSCQIPSDDPAVLSKAFKLISESLLRTSAYPKTAKDGFANILAFRAANKKDLSALSDDKFPASPLNLFLWVLGPPLPFGLGWFRFQYYVKAEYTEPKTATDPFFLKFETEADARIKADTEIVGLENIPDTTLSGRAKKGGKTTWLKNVQGSWYVTPDGYLRYYTAAQFPMKLKDIATQGRRILIDTLVFAQSRGDWESAP